jgi:photosynthetic reaction center cytochrome c subunit
MQRNLSSAAATCLVVACLLWTELPAASRYTGTAISEHADDANASAFSQADAAPGDQERALAEVRKFIGDRGTEPAEKIFRHIEVLKGKPASRLPGMMAALTGLLGVRCSHCHVPGRWESEEKHAKQVAREQFAMQATINSRYFRGENKITCWTCHRGQPVPESLPPARK